MTFPTPLVLENYDVSGKKDTAATAAQEDGLFRVLHPAR
jgi:hypothetical protein